jgi:hypothetical protein
LPGTATEADALRLDDREDRICELVEKDMSTFESSLAATLIRQIGNFLDANNLGILIGADGKLQILPNRIRISDVA